MTNALQSGWVLPLVGLGEGVGEAPATPALRPEPGLAVVVFDPPHRSFPVFDAVF